MLALPRRSLLAAFMIIGSVLFLGACGKDEGTPVTPIPILTQDEADDIAQQVGAMVGAGIGGWFYEVQSTVQAMPSYTTANLRSWANGAERETTFVPNEITYRIVYTYRSAGGGESPTWDSTAVEVEGVSRATGTLVKPPDQHDGEFWHNSIFTAYGLEATQDTLNFSALGEDTTFAKIRNFVSGEIKYYFMDAFVDYDFYIYRDPNRNAFPLHGECNFTIDTDRCTALDRNTAVRNLLVDMTIVFDGTPTPTATIVEDPGDPRTIFRYKIDLRDGTVARAP